VALCYPPTAAYASRLSFAATSFRRQYSPSTATYSAVTALSHRYVPLRLLHISRRHCYTPSATYAASSSRHSWYSSTAIYARRHHSAAMSFRCRWCASTATISSGKVKLPLHAKCILSHYFFQRTLCHASLAHSHDLIATLCMPAKLKFHCSNLPSAPVTLPPPWHWYADISFLRYYFTSTATTTAVKWSSPCNILMS